MLFPVPGMSFPLLLTWSSVTPTSSLSPRLSSSGSLELLPAGFHCCDSSVCPSSTDQKPLKVQDPMTSLAPGPGTSQTLCRPMADLAGKAAPCPPTCEPPDQAPACLQICYQPRVTTAPPQLITMSPEQGPRKDHRKKRFETRRKRGFPKGPQQLSSGWPHLSLLGVAGGTTAPKMCMS